VSTASATLPSLIGIAGYARAGKDTAAQALHERWGYTSTGTSDSLVDMAMKIAPESVSEPLRQLGVEQAKNTHPEVREWLVKLGLACREVFAEGEDFVVMEAIRRAQLAGPTIITGLRFVREAELLRQQDPNAVVFRVERWGYGAHSDFEREVPDIEVDFVVKNNHDVFSFQFDVCQSLVDFCLYGHTVD